MSKDAAAGKLVYELNSDIYAGTATWNSDLVLGSSPLGVKPPVAPVKIHRMIPATIQIAIEVKSVMTEHRKAIKNRKRDLEAHHDHVHRYNTDAIAAAVLIVNASERFVSPLRGGKITSHREPLNLVEHCIRELRATSLRTDLGSSGLEAKCALVLVHDNIDNSQTRYLTKKPAPETGDPLHYDSFIQRICALYTQRFSLEGKGD
ncbi:MAG: hypothetical protein PHN75_15865 [Syntrophales bacterium]|nr:hypothetical protein [Syntrophales bacterium]